MNINKLLKGGQLTEIEVDEVSLVGAPANGRRFLFTKAADMEFTIKTDQTFGGTTISVNGEELEGLDSFYLSINDVSKEDQEEWGATPVSGSWSLKESSADGVEQRTIFSLQSDEVKKMEKSDVIKLIKSDYGIDITEADFDALSDDKQVSLTGFATFSKAMPEPFKKAQATAIAEMVKADEKPPEETPAAGAETPPETPPEAPAALTEESVKAMIAEALAEKNKPAEGEGAAESDIEKAVAKMQADIAAIGKATNAKLSSETEVEKGGEAEDKWASIDLS